MMISTILFVTLISEQLGVQRNRALRLWKKLGIVSLILSSIAIIAGSIQMSVGPYFPYNLGAPVVAGAMVSYSSHMLGIVSLILSFIAIISGSIQMVVGPCFPYNLGAPVVACALCNGKLLITQAGYCKPYIIIYRHNSWLYTDVCWSLLPLQSWSISCSLRNGKLLITQAGYCKSYIIIYCHNSWLHTDVCWSLLPLQSWSISCSLRNGKLLITQAGYCKSYIIIYCHNSWLHTDGCWSLLPLQSWSISGSLSNGKILITQAGYCKPYIIIYPHIAGSIQMAVGPYFPYNLGAQVVADAMVSYLSHKLGILCLITLRHNSWLHTTGCGTLLHLPSWCTSGSWCNGMFLITQLIDLAGNCKPLSNDKQAIDAFNTTSKYLDDILNINNIYFTKWKSK